MRGTKLAHTQSEVDTLKGNSPSGFGREKLKSTRREDGRGKKARRQSNSTITWLGSKGKGKRPNVRRDRVKTKKKREHGKKGDLLDLFGMGAGGGGEKKINS